jgi:hypothetical protein
MLSSQEIPQESGHDVELVVMDPVARVLDLLDA